MNPYNEPPRRVGSSLKSWRGLLPAPARRIDALGRARLTLAAALESEAQGALSALAGETDSETLRGASLIARVDLEQEISLAALFPRARACEALLTALFMYAELLSAAAQAEPDARARAAMDFLLPEACDMLYRVANLMSLVYGLSADVILCGQAEVLPGRPCVAAHRHPFDDVHAPLADLRPQTLLSLTLLRAAARYTAHTATGAMASRSAKERALCAELTLLLSAHAVQWLSLLGEGGALPRHEYAECYLYYSLLAQETDARLHDLYSRSLEAELAHLQKAAALCPGRAPFPHADFPAPLWLRASKGYIRDALRLVGATVRRGETLPVGALPGGADFFRYQAWMNFDEQAVPSHAVVLAHIQKTGADYRVQIAPHPVETLRCRTADSCHVGR